MQSDGQQDKTQLKNVTLASWPCVDKAEKTGMSLTIRHRPQFVLTFLVTTVNGGGVQEMSDLVQLLTVTLQRKSKENVKAINVSIDKCISLRSADVCRKQRFMF